MDTQPTPNPTPEGQPQPAAAPETQPLAPATPAAPSPAPAAPAAPAADSQPPAASPAPTQPAITGPAQAEDVDVIEKAWVDKAQQVVHAYREDPHAEENAVEDLQIDYLKKRYGKDIKKAPEE